MPLSKETKQTVSTERVYGILGRHTEGTITMPRNYEPNIYRIGHLKKAGVFNSWNMSTKTNKKKTAAKTKSPYSISVFIYFF